MNAGERSVLVVTGLKREAAILAGDGVRTVVGGGDSGALELGLKQAISDGEVAGVISAGLAGALAPHLNVGDWVVAEAVVSGDTRHPTDRAWTQRLRLSLDTAMEPLALPASPGPSLLRKGRGEEILLPLRKKEGARAGRVFAGLMAASDNMVVSATAKTTLHTHTGALAVDMESHVAARFAKENDLPFATVRVISDAAERALPKAAQAGLKKDGGMDILAVIQSLAADPRQLPALIRTGREAEVAFRCLRLLSGHDPLCGPGIGCPYLR